MSLFRRGSVIAAALILIGPPMAYSQDLWTSKDGSIRNFDTRAIYADGARMYLATKTELYASGAPQDRWESIFYIASNDNEIACVDGNSDNLFVGTKKGLFRSQDLGKTWRRVFKTIIPEKGSILAIDVSRHNRDLIMIGTGSGLYVSVDGGNRWNEASGALKNRRVKCVSLNNEHAFAGADDGLYMAKIGSYDWRRVFAYIDVSDAGDLPEESSDNTETEEDAGAGIKCIAQKGAKIYIAFNRRIRYSDDTAKSWKDLSTSGLGGSVNSILVSNASEGLYCATTKGVYEFEQDNNKWSELYKGMDRTPNVNNIVFGSVDEKTLWAGTDKGVYKLEIGSFMENPYVDVEKSLNTAKVIFDGEPSFKELQAAALKFNEVSPDKIKKWRSDARMKALAPKVNIGLGSSKSNTYEIYTSATRDYVVAGPDDISDGFDVSVSWDLADLIWSDDQTSIDVRSRLTTQLRNDILDDLRRAYYERERLKYELVVSPPVEAKLRFEKELRIRELTQAIDDITGNYFTENIKDRD